MTSKIAVIETCDNCKKRFKFNNNSSNLLGYFCENCIPKQGELLEKEMISKCKHSDMFYKFYLKKEDELKVHKKLKKFTEVDRFKLNSLGWNEVAENVFLISNNEMSIISSVSVMYLLNKSNGSFSKICDFTNDGDGNLNVLNLYLEKGYIFLEPFLLMYDGRKSLGFYKR